MPSASSSASQAPPSVHRVHRVGCRCSRIPRLQGFRHRHIPAFVQDVSIAVAIAFWYVRAPAFVDVSRTVADSALVVVTHAVVYVVEMPSASSSASHCRIHRVHRVGCRCRRSRLQGFRHRHRPRIRPRRFHRSRNRLLVCQSTRIRRCLPDRCRFHTRRSHPSQSSTSSQMPSASSSASCIRMHLVRQLVAVPSVSLRQFPSQS